jgi:hypothetical protein
MKLKKYNQYIKEDLTPMSAEAENDMTGGIEGEIVGQDDEFMDYDGDDASTLIGNNMNDIEGEGEEEGNEYEGTKLMKELADKLRVKVENGMINFNGKKIEHFSETGSFAIDRKPQIVKDHNNQPRPLTTDEVVDKLTK